ncbi:hypothetical protein CORC01_07444 [Colletotrichum orchidophilum]|uniref:Uncharacterized protein n=1 Tax=Colletotrichum orchidophilum TaxID=1209926 RepID=A0A1G4B6W4_9PEZI|nr:uncharacterized protein CORC01_07444 [Colletotrichum orchidophilum]OHE97190.1 hypothetical protein CORC01_07444 [Colletotrichum orchidophilum]
MSALLYKEQLGLFERNGGKASWGNVYRVATPAPAAAIPKGLTLAVKLLAVRESAIRGPGHDTALNTPPVDGRDVRGLDTARAHIVRNTCVSVPPDPFGPSTTYEFSLTPGPDTCRVSRCSNNQVRLHDARFTNHLCWDHQPTEVQDAYLLGYLFGEQDVHAANANDHQQQRSRRRRSRKKPKSTSAATEPATAAGPQEQASEEPSSSSEDDDIVVVAHQLSTIGEEPERDDVTRPTRKPRQENPETEPGTPTARRSQKTVHFAEPPPRASAAAETPSVKTTADAWVAEPFSSSAAARLRTSHHRRSLDGRSGTRSSPKTSGSLAAPAALSRERRHSTGSAPKSADVKRATRTRASR